MKDSIGRNPKQGIPLKETKMIKDIWVQLVKFGQTTTDDMLTGISWVSKSKSLLVLMAAILFPLYPHSCYGAGSGKSFNSFNENVEYSKNLSRFLELKSPTHVHIAILPLHALYLNSPSETELWARGCSFEVSDLSKIKSLTNVFNDTSIEFGEKKSSLLSPYFGAEFTFNSGEKAKIVLSSIGPKDTIFGVFDGNKINVQKNIYQKLRRFLNTLESQKSWACSALGEQE